MNGTRLVYILVGGTLTFVLFFQIINMVGG